MWSEWLREWKWEFVEEEVHGGLDGRAAFFHDLPGQLMTEREREAMEVEAQKKQLATVMGKVEERRARMQRTMHKYRPPALAHSAAPVLAEP